MAKETLTTQIRLPADLFDYIRSEANRTGVSQNGIMLILMDIGRKLAEAPITRKADEEPARDPLHTSQQRP